MEHCELSCECFNDVGDSFDKTYPNQNNRFLVRKIRENLIEWRETKNNDLIDVAIEYANVAHLPIDGVFLEIVAHLATKRYQRDYKVINQLQNNNKNERNNGKNHCYRRIYDLINLGIPFEYSCQLVAVWAYKHLPRAYKASNLMKGYKSWLEETCYQNPILSVSGEQDEYLRKLGYEPNDPLLEDENIIGIRR